MTRWLDTVVPCSVLISHVSSGSQLTSWISRTSAQTSIIYLSRRTVYTNAHTADVLRSIISAWYNNVTNQFVRHH